jgi:hypothetical protein
LLRYRLAQQKPPLILYRDVIARLGLAIPFDAILFARAIREFGVDTTGLVANPWWIYGTSLPAVLGAAVYAYFELFIIEHNGHTVSSPSPTSESAVQQQDRLVGDERRRLQKKDLAGPQGELAETTDGKDQDVVLTE